MVNLKLMRIERLNCTQQQLADLSGVSRATIGQIERGKAPSPIVAKKIAKVLTFDWRLFFE